jgi:hypothetical protein
LSRPSLALIAISAPLAALIHVVGRIDDQAADAA